MGNTCRSPMAEYIFRQKTSHFKGYFNVNSFGFAAVDGTPVSENAFLAMQNRNIDISAHKAHKISANIIAAADYIFCMSEHIYSIVTVAAPEKTFLFGGGIDDPYGQGIDEYIRCADVISEEIDKLLASDLFFDTRLMEYRDISAVSDIEHSSFTDPWSENSFYAHISLEYSRSFVVTFLDKPVGFICCEHLIDEMSLLDVAVDEKMRNRGIAERLITLISDLCNYLDVLVLMLEVRESNIPAQNLYKKLGFKNEGIRKGYYSRPKEDAYIMTKYFVKEELLNENTCY